MIRLYFLLCISILCICQGCCDINQQNIDFAEINIDDIPKQKVRLSDIYSEIEFIPLENNIHCMLNNVSKIVPMNNGYLILNKSSFPSVYLFDANGRYKCKVGRFGKAKGEYQNNVLSITSNRNGDSLIISTFEELLCYDKDGRFLFSKRCDFGIPFDIEKSNGGYVISSDYHGTENTLHIIDNAFDVIGKLNPSKNIFISNWGMHNNPIRIEDNMIYFYNQYDSKFQCFNSKQNYVEKEIKLKSKNMIDIDLFSDTNDPFENDFDIVYEYTVFNKIISGNIIINGCTYDFELNTCTDEINIYDIDSWIPRHDAYFNEYVITILPQDEFLSFREGDKKKLFEGFDKCNYEEIEGNISKLDNFIIAKLKRRKR